MKARLPLILLLGFGLLCWGQLWLVYGYEGVWRFWNIPVMMPPFGDLRTITGGAESFRQGFDPMVNNPGDPLGRQMNYPRIWQRLFALGLEPQHTVAMGILAVVLFLVGVLVFVPGLGWGTAALLVAGIFSPAVLLGIERGNTDLSMFFLLAVAIAIGRWQALIALALIWTGFALKLFPLFGLVLLLNQRPSRFAWMMGLSALMVGGYLIVNHADLVLMRQGSPYNSDLSYGRNVLWMELARTHPALGNWPRIASWIMIAGAFLGSLMTLVRGNPLPAPPTAESERELDGFRVGTAIYLGTFLIGNSYDYRLMFLLFAMPQLASWGQKGGPGHTAALARASLVGILLAMWYLVFIRWSLFWASGPRMCLFFAETARWLVFLCLGPLFCASLPDWVVSPLRNRWQAFRGQVPATADQDAGPTPAGVI